MNVNKQNDFAIVERLGAHLSGLPFLFTYSVGNVSYIAEYDGETYTNCAKRDNGDIVISFHDHFFPEGVMRCEHKFFKSDDTVPNGHVTIVRSGNLPITLVDDPFCPTYEAMCCTIPGIDGTDEDVTILGGTMTAGWEIVDQTLISDWYVKDRTLIYIGNKALI